MRLHACVLAVTLAASACGETPITVLEFRPLLVRARCEATVRCGGATDIDGCTLGLDSEAWVWWYVTSVTAGRIAFDADAAARCLDAVARESCAQVAGWSDWPAVCDEVFAPRVADRGACAIDADCISGGCLGAQCDGLCCLGTCGISSSDVDACAADAQCAHGEYCSLNLTCTPKLGEGAPCLAQAACADGLACFGQTCQRLPSRGEPCLGRGCASVGDYCDAEHVCAPRGELGAACTSDAGCQTPLRCDPTTHTCAPPAQLGESCTGICASGLYCDHATARCAPLAAPGASCHSTNGCADDGVCDLARDPPVCADQLSCP